MNTDFFFIFLKVIKKRCACTACKASLLHIHASHSQSNTVFGLHLLVFGFRCRFELCVKIAKILEEGTNRTEERSESSISTSEENIQSVRLFARKWCKNRLCLDDIKGYMSKPEWHSKRSPNKLLCSRQERDQRLQALL